MTETARARLETVLSDIRSVEARHGLATDSTTLIAVSKMFPADEIRPILEAGQKVFGENRVQEAMGKWPSLREGFTGVELHLIGPLQSNKSKEAVATFDVIHTVDRDKIARALKVEMKKQGRDLPCFIQVNTGEEPQKAGVPPQDVDAFVDVCKEDIGLNIVGLMCIPPVEDAPGPHFALLEKIASRNRLDKLSMGMSSDYQTAISFGASHVRVGSAIFGSRDYS